VRDSFGIRSLICTDHVIFFFDIESVESGFVATCSIKFVALVDGKVWGGSGEFQDCKAFFCTELACTCSKGLDGGKRVALPEDFYFVLDMVFNVF
jgi:hypothetical protein